MRICWLFAVSLIACSPVSIDYDGNGRVDVDERCIAICKCDPDPNGCAADCESLGPPVPLVCAKEVAQCVAQAEHDDDCQYQDTFCFSGSGSSGDTLCDCRKEHCPSSNPQ